MQSSTEVAEEKTLSFVRSERERYMRDEKYVQRVVKQIGGVQRWNIPIPYYGGDDIRRFMTKVWHSPVNGDLVCFMNASSKIDIGFPFRCMTEVELIMLHSFAPIGDKWCEPRVNVEFHHLSSDEVKDFVERSDDRESVLDIIGSGMLNQMEMVAKMINETKEETSEEVNLRRLAYVESVQKALNWYHR